MLETWSTLAALAEATSPHRADRCDQAAAVQPAGVRQDRGQHRRDRRGPTGDQPRQRLVPARTRSAGPRPARPRRPLRLLARMARRQSPDLWAGKQVAHRRPRRPTRAGSPDARRTAAGVRRRRVRAGPRAGRTSTRDVFFINGRPLADTVDVIEDLRARPRDREPLRFGLSAFVIARETEAEAIAELRPSAVAGRRRETARDLRRAPTRTPRCTRCWQAPAAIGSNGGTLAGLVGSYDQVIERIEAFHAAGVELFMLQFQPLECGAGPVRGQDHSPFPLKCRRFPGDNSDP